MAQNGLIFLESTDTHKGQIEWRRDEVSGNISYIQFRLIIEVLENTTPLTIGGTVTAEHAVAGDPVAGTSSIELSISPRGVQDIYYSNWSSNRLRVFHNDEGAGEFSFKTSLGNPFSQTAINSGLITLDTVPIVPVVVFHGGVPAVDSIILNYSVNKTYQKAEYRLNNGDWATLPLSNKIENLESDTVYVVDLRILSKTNSYSLVHSKTFVTVSIVTACSAPINININRPVVALNDSVLVSWGGATPGHNNPIQGYKIYYYKTDTVNDSTPFKLIETTLTYGSIALSFSEAQRGEVYHIAIQTIGLVQDNENTYDSEIKIGSSVTINTLPLITLAKANKEVVRSTGDEVIFTLQGTDTDPTQTVSFYYTLPSSETKVRFYSGDKLFIDTTTTYSFWAYDGIEYSASATPVTIIAGIPVSILAMDYTPMTETAETQYLNYVNQIKNIEITLSEKRAGTYYWLYRTGTTENLENELEYLITTSTAPLLSSFFAADLNKIKVNSYYQLGLYFIDYQGNKTITFWDNNIYQLAPWGDTIEHFNQHSSSNILNSSVFNKKIRVKFKGDSGISKINLLVNSTYTYSPIHFSVGSNSQSGYADFSFNETFEGLVHFTFILTKPGGQREYYFNRAAIQKLMLGAISAVEGLTPSRTLFPHTDSYLNFSISFPNPFGTVDNFTSFGFLEGLVNLPNQLDVIIQYETEGIELFFGSEDIAITSSNITIDLSLNQSLITALGINNFNHLYSCPITLIFKDIFGEKEIVYSHSNNNLQIDFRENLPLGASNDLIVKLDGVLIEENSQNSVVFLYESQQIEFYYNYSLYNSVPLDIIVQQASFNIETEITSDWQNINIISNRPLLSSEFLDIGDLYIGNLSLAKNYIEIAAPDHIKYRIVITSSCFTGDIVLESNIVFSLVRQEIPQVTFLSQGYSTSSEQLIFKYDIEETGYSILDTTENLDSLFEIEAYITILDEYNQVYETYELVSKQLVSEAIFNQLLEESEKTITNFEFPSRGGNIRSPVCFAILTVKVIATETNLARTYISETLSIFNALPTVTYRPNQVNINSLDTRSDSVAIINATNIGKKIILEDKSTQKIIEVNLQHGTISGVKIDCGEW